MGKPKQLKGTRKAKAANQGNLAKARYTLDMKKRATEIAPITIPKTQQPEQEPLGPKSIPNDAGRSSIRRSWCLATRLLTDILAIIGERALTLNDKEPGSNTQDSTPCPHMATVGSSQFRKLLEGSLDFKTLHNRSYYVGAQADGKYWELDFSEYYNVTVHEPPSDDGKRVMIHESLTTSLTRYSLNFPWICATPDRISQVTFEGKVQLALFEVKSFISKEGYKYALTHHEKQLQVALDCFNINLGFLICYLYEKPTDTSYKQLDFNVICVRRSHILTTDVKKHVEAYAKHLNQLIKSLSGVSLGSRVSKRLWKLVSGDSQPQTETLKEMSVWPVLPSRPGCVAGRYYKKKGHIRKLLNFYAVPHTFFNNLCSHD